MDATLTVRLTAGKSTYAMGEIIPLELEFRGRAGPDLLYFSTGQMRHERYVVTPEGGADDPLREYYSSVGVVGGGLSGWHPLDGTPFVLRVQLNEWVRFTKPGEYRLVVESTRLGRYSREPAPTLSSSPVALHIETPTPEWASAEVARAVAALEGRGPGTALEGTAILRHLGTTDAALALVRLYGAGGTRLRFDWTAGLVASPHRAEIVEAMEARVDAGEPLPAGFVRDLALLRSFLDLPGGSYADRFERQKAAECDYARRSLEALGRGTPTTEALEAALAALEELLEPPCETSLPALLGAHPATAREAFLALPRPTQALLLGYRWSGIAGPWIQPALEAVYDRWRGDSRFPGVGDAALRRLAEMDPARGRSLAIDEIRTGARGLAPETLTSLLGESVPDLDEALRQRYRAARTEEGQAATMEADRPVRLGAPSPPGAGRDRPRPVLPARGRSARVPARARSPARPPAPAARVRSPPLGHVRGSPLVGDRLVALGPGRRGRGDRPPAGRESPPRVGRRADPRGARVGAEPRAPSSIASPAGTRSGSAARVSSMLSSRVRSPSTRRSSSRVRSWALSWTAVHSR